MWSISKYDSLKSTSYGIEAIKCQKVLWTVKYLKPPADSHLGFINLQLIQLLSKKNETVKSVGNSTGSKAKEKYAKFTPEQQAVSASTLHCYTAICHLSKELEWGIKASSLETLKGKVCGRTKSKA